MTDATEPAPTLTVRHVNTLLGWMDGADHAVDDDCGPHRVLTLPAATFDALRAFLLAYDPNEVPRLRDLQRAKERTVEGLKAELNAYHEQVDAAARAVGYTNEVNTTPWSWMQFEVERAHRALRNVLALAMRMKHRGVLEADHLLRFCKEAGVEPSILRIEGKLQVGEEE